MLQVVDDDLQQDCGDYLALRDLMQALYTFLLERDSVEIDRLNRQIGRHVASLGGRAERRGKVLAAFRLREDGDGMQRLLNGYPEARRAALQQRWQQLGQLAAECQQLNERNGKLLAMHHEILEQLLAAHQQTHLYGPQAY
nr:flagellar protein FlgN [Stutzerimonas sp. S1]